MSEQSELEKWAEDFFEGDNSFGMISLQLATVPHVATHLLNIAEDWCGINTSDPDKGQCDEDTHCQRRGVWYSAEDLLDYLRSYCAKGKKES